MKKRIIFSKAILACIVASTMLISCNNDKSITPSVLPEFTGEIKVDRESIGVGQKFAVSYNIPGGGSNVEPTGNMLYIGPVAINKGVEDGYKELSIVLQNAKNKVTMAYKMAVAGVVSLSSTYTAK